jgi:serine/threonine protein kinase
VLAERFRLERVLGRGGMGLVYGGLDLRSGQPVAIKVIRPEAKDGSEPLERFVREAKHTARLVHPNIVQVLDLGRSADGELYFAMEHLDGESLAATLKRERRLPAARVAHIGRQVCAALALAHAKGIVHRDIKPANVMRVKHGADLDFVKVLDFGIARALDGETRLTETGMLVGTVEYMAPEQILGAPFDNRADLYAVGGMLYRLLTGTTVFPGTSPAGVVYHHVNTPPEAPRQRAADADIPPPLERVVLRCLEKAPEQRYATAEALGEALAAAMASDADDGLATTAVRPHGPAPIAAVERLELDTAAPMDVPFRRCAICETEASRFATRCASCGADLTTPEQLAYLSTVLAARGAPLVTASPELPLAAEPQPPAPAPRPPSDDPLQRALDAIPDVWLQRVALWALLASGTLWFFGYVSSGEALGLFAVAFAAVAALVLRERP